MSLQRRVVITGLGAITPIGIGLDAIRASLRAGQSAVSTLTRFDPGPFRTHIAAQVNDFAAMIISTLAASSVWIDSGSSASSRQTWHWPMQGSIWQRSRARMSV